jgi:hypothetical protein
VAVHPGRRWRAIRATGRMGVVAIAAVLSACTTSTGRATPPTTAVAASTSPATLPSISSRTTEPVTTTTFPAAFGVGIRSISMLDTTRPTENFATSPPSVLTPYRVIDTQIRYPTLSRVAGTEQSGAAPALGFGPFPVIVFAHGYAVMPNTYEDLLDAWVRAGFVVVSPVFPVSNYYEWTKQGGGSAPENDIGNQPADVAFVVSQLAKLAGTTGSFLRGLVDLQRLGLAGQSDGATTVGGLVYAYHWRAYFAGMPVHPRAVALLSGAEFEQAGSYSVPEPSRPAVLSVESNTDYCNPTTHATTLYAAAAPGARQHWFMILENADHLGPYAGQPPWAPVVARVTTDFFELELGPRGRSMTATIVTRVGDASRVSSMSDATSVTLPATSAEGACGTPTPDPPY